MTSNPVTVDVATDAERFLATDSAVWFQEVSAAPAEVRLTGLHPEQRFAAQVDGGGESTYAGVYAVFPMSLVLPGERQVPAAGLSFVGVHPDQRRRGVLTAMMRHHLERVRDTEGVHVSVLHASEPAIYGRYGYGLAGLELHVDLGRGTTLTAPGLDEQAKQVTTEFGSITDPGVAERMRAVHLAHAEVGSVVGDQGYYDRICTVLPEELRDKEVHRVLFARRDGEDVGFTVFRREHKWENGRPGGTLSVWTVQGDVVARLVLLRRLVDFDLMGSVKVGSVGAEDPLFDWVAGPRGTGDVKTYDGLWVRLVDLPAALEARAWSADCEVTVEVEDTGAPWNAGTWRVKAAGGEAAVQRTDADADLKFDVTVLGAAYLGGGNLVVAHRAGLVEERRPGAVAELWRAMRTDVAPTAAVGF